MQHLPFAFLLAGALAATSPVGAGAAPLTSLHAAACDSRAFSGASAGPFGEGHAGACRHTAAARWASNPRRHHGRDGVGQAWPAGVVPYSEPVSNYQYGNGTYAYGPNGGLAVYVAGAYSPGPRIIHIPPGYGLDR